MDFWDMVFMLRGGGGNSDGIAYLTVTYPVGSTCTCSKDGTTLTASDTSGEYVFTIPEAGDWIVAITDGTDNSSKTITISEGIIPESDAGLYELEIDYAHVYGAEWDGTSTTAWTRTDAAANFTDPVPYVAGASSYGSPFDNLYPWKDMTIVEDANAGTMVKIPKFWYKLTQTGNAIKIQIADDEKDGYSVCPACMDRGDGAGERDYVLVGRYHCATSTYKSTTGVKPAVSATKSSFRSSIHNLGSNIWQIDFATWFTIWLLYLVEFANWNSQAKIGYGCGNNSSTGNMGYTDSMPYHTGTTQSSRTTYGLGTQYRHIEGLWDNVYDFGDGCYYNSNGLNIIKNPSLFSDSANGTLIAKPSSGFPSAFTVKNVSGTYPMFVPTTASGSDSTYSCDEWLFDASKQCPYIGGNCHQFMSRGMFNVDVTSTSTTSLYIGSRPMKLP